MKELSDQEMKQILLNCPASLTAKLVGYSERHLLRLSKSGLIKQVGRGKYNVFEVIERLSSKHDDLTELQQAELSMVTERARSLKLANDSKEQGLIPVDDVEEFAVSFSKLFTDTVDSTEESVKELLPHKTQVKLSERVRDTKRALNEIRDNFLESLVRKR